MQLVVSEPVVDVGSDFNIPEEEAQKTSNIRMIFGIIAAVAVGIVVVVVVVKLRKKKKAAKQLPPPLESCSVCFRRCVRQCTLHFSLFSFP